jgi:hypothetical protein
MAHESRSIRDPSQDFSSSSGRQQLSTSKIAVVGLGYVGLPLAVALARHDAVTGYDHDPQRIRELGAGRDRTGGFTSDALAETALKLTANGSALVGHDIYIITVPTPVDCHNVPDLSAVCSACRTIGGGRSRGAGEHGLSRRHRAGRRPGARGSLWTTLRCRFLPRLLARADQPG